MTGKKQAESRKYNKISRYLLYTVLMAVLVILITLIFLINVTSHNKENYYNYMDYYADQIQVNLERLIENMDYITIFLMSDSDVLAAVNSLSQPEFKNGFPGNYSSIYTLQKALKTYCIDKYYHRVSYYNKNGIFVTSQYRGSNVSSNEEVKKIEEEELKFDFSEKNLIFYPAHEDSWSKDSPEIVVSRIRKIIGINKGYFEVQVTYKDYSLLFQTPRSYEGVSVMATLNNEVIYTEIENQKLIQKLRGLPDNLDTSCGKYLLSSRTYDINGDILTVYYEIPQGQLVASVIKIYICMLLLMLLFLTISVIYYYSYMKKLIIPITHLKEQMDKTNIENLNFDIELPEKEDMLDELISLNNGYRKLMLRIKEGIIREERLGQLQMRTNMDVLQAQINPHFINNTLNVISYRGALSGDDDICEICNCITQMLQYTTNLKKRVATVREEIEYLEMYLMILKHRYREKLVYEIQIDEQIYCERLPKITLQQIVENSISHEIGRAHV